MQEAYQALTINWRVDRKGLYAFFVRMLVDRIGKKYFLSHLHKKSGAWRLVLL